MPRNTNNTTLSHLATQLAAVETEAIPSAEAGARARHFVLAVDRQTHRQVAAAIINLSVSQRQTTKVQDQRVKLIQPDAQLNAIK